MPTKNCSMSTSGGVIYVKKMQDGYITSEKNPSRHSRPVPPFRISLQPKTNWSSRMEDFRAWIHGDETAKEFLSRVFTDRPPLLLPPLHRVPLRAGNVVEIVGPSPSAKSQILVQAAISCVLPKEWNGIHFGGLERIVMYFDLDCRFDVLRFSRALKVRIAEAFGLKNYNSMVAEVSPFDDELFLACMRRFLYIRCYNSYEFLAALKTMHHQSEKEVEALGVGVHFLMIDSIGAFHWIDRACQPLPHVDYKRKTLSLQSLAETIVQEIRKLSQVQPLLVLATKASIFGAGTSTNDATSMVAGKWSSEGMTDLRTLTREREKLLYREYMPLTWQSFVTHRIHLGLSDGTSGDKEHGTFPIYTSEWVQPPLKIVDKFTVKDNGIFMIS